ncbi:MAG: NAD(P)H-dependent oxidoreductase [Bacteroidota bacterium]
MYQEILVFGASNSQKSVNSQFAQFAAEKLNNVNLNIVRLNDFELPIYSIDLENESGIPENASKFFDLIKKSDGIVASFAEHNGLYTSAFKNLWDWMSRIPMEKKFNLWQGKPILLLSASPSSRPKNNVVRVSKELFPHFGANIIATFYLHSFHQNFGDHGITNKTLEVEFNRQVEIFQKHLNTS